MDDLTFWFIARITGLTAFAVLSLSVLAGEALRTSVLDFLAKNRAIRKLHDFTTPLWLPLVDEQHAVDVDPPHELRRLRRALLPRRALGDGLRRTACLGARMVDRR